MTAYSVAPFHKGKLIFNILLAPYFVTLFDVGFSKVFQDKQISILLCHWDNTKQLLSNRYFDSLILKRPSAENLL